MQVFYQQLRVTIQQFKCNLLAISLHYNLQRFVFALNSPQISILQTSINYYWKIIIKKH